MGALAGIASGKLTRDRTLIDATSGNTGIAYAMIGAALGYRVEVADNGPGIPREDLPYIFDMFYRGSSSRREQGMGLGLAVVKNIVESHGWTIDVHSKPGSGSVFGISIPRP